jgi:CheY-like chemotaxis protein/Tfp pilus assembly protein PilZ
MTEHIRMLSIDDKTLTTDLDRAGYRKMGVLVKAAANFEEAVGYLEAGNIDLIVINMDYARIDAPTITKHFKSHAEYNEIPVVVTSVQTAARVRKAALEAGADLFVEQPLPRQYFIEKLKKLLEQSTRTDERVDFGGNVEFSFANTSDKCPIGDLSSSGILLSTTSEIPDGTEVEVSFDIPGYKKPIQATGVVVRTIRSKDPSRKSGVGVRFQQFQGDSEKRLEKYIARSSDKENKMIYYL